MKTSPVNYTDRGVNFQNLYRFLNSSLLKIVILWKTMLQSIYFEHKIIFRPRKHVLLPSIIDNNKD